MKVKAERNPAEAERKDVPEANVESVIIPCDRENREGYALGDLAVFVRFRSTTRFEDACVGI